MQQQIKPNVKTNILIVFLIYLTLISGISPLPLVSPNVEHFPYGILLAIFSKWERRDLIFALLLLIYFFSSFFILEKASFFYIVQAINFISPLLFFKRYQLDINLIARIVFYTYFFIGCLQALSLLNWAEPFLQLIIPRFSGDPWGSYRGVSMLETEPARASFQLLMLFIVGRPFNSLFGRKDYTMIAILFFSQIVLIKSTTGLLLSSALVLIIFASKFEIKLRNTIIFICIIVAFIFIAPLNPKIETLIRLISDNGVQGAYEALAATSGGRFLGLVNTINDIIVRPLGYGADYTYFSIDQAGLDESIAIDGYKTHVGNRAVSAPAVFTRTFGVFFFIYLIFLMRYKVYKNINRYSIGILIIVTAYSPPGSEIVLTGVLMASYWHVNKTK